MSKSELRRLEIVAPEAIKQLREQIAREIEAECKQGGAMACGISGNYQCSCSGAAAIARGEK